MMKYTLIDKTSTEQIAQLAVCLTNEIIDRTGIKHFDVDISHAKKLCASYVSNGVYQIMAAFTDDEVVGFGAVCESHSLYAEGAFGIIQEFYVLPEYRSKGVGKALINEIAHLAHRKGWKRLELCTPPLPEFERTVAFYLKNGFEITGGYKMKYVIT